MLRSLGRGVVVAAALPLLVGVLALPRARADDDDRPEVPDVDEREEPPPPDEPPTLERALGLLGEGREDEGAAHLRARPRDEALTAARALLASARDGAVLIGAAEWLAQAPPPPRPGRPPEDLARPVRERLAAGRDDPALRPALLEALGALSAGGDLLVLERAFLDAPADAAAAARGLCRSRDPQGVRLLAAALEGLRARRAAADDDEDGRAEAAGLALQAAAGGEALRWAARSDRAVRLAEVAREAHDAALLEALRHVRSRAGREAALALAGDLVDHADEAPRAAAVRLIVAARGASEEEVQRLLAALDDPAPAVRVAAVEGMWPLQLRTAIPRLIELLDDEEARRAAHEALKRFAGKPLPARRATWEDWARQEQRRRPE